MPTLYKYLFIVIFLLSINFSKAFVPPDGGEIFEKKCISCHNNNHRLNFLDKTIFASTKKTMVYLIENGIMPPWYADTTYSRFKNEHVLTKNEKTSLLSWLKKSDVTYRPNARLNYDLPKPDLVIPIANGFTVKGDNQDRFVLFKIPYEIPSDTFVSCIEFVPKSNPQINHHFNCELVTNNNSVSDTAGYKVFELPNIDFPGDSFFTVLDVKAPKHYMYYASWVPGMTATKFRDPFAVFMPKKGYIIVRLMHYSPTPIDVIDSCYFNIYFNKVKKDKLIRQIRVLGVGSNFTPIEPDLELNPGDKKMFYSVQTIPNDIVAYSINPHMHLLGKEFTAYATYNNDTLPLIKINNWNFDFQENYIFNDPIFFRAGTKIHIFGYFDNSLGNPRNPYIPPKYVSGDDGMFTRGEMLLMTMLYVNIDSQDYEHIEISK